MPWEKVDENEPLESGDEVRTIHCINTANIPFSDIQARLAIGLGNLTDSLNDELPDCMDAEVTDTELKEASGFVVDGVECDYKYITTYKINEINGDCPDATAGVLGHALILALAAFITFGAISVMFHEARKFTEAPGGEEATRNVSTGLLLLAGGWAFKQFAEAGGKDRVRRALGQAEPDESDDE